MSLVTSLLVGAANELIYVVPLSLIVGWLLGYRVDAFQVFTTVVVAIAVSYGFGLFFAHPAPYQVQQTIVSDTPVNSFPSQHTTVLFAFALAALWQKHYAVGTAFVALAVIVGAARVAVGYHWPIDIIGALAATIVAIAFVATIEASVEQLAENVIEVEYRVRSAVSTE
ncbi:phosphatase PAP2 family protein [Halobaculum roseum]|uniref:Phosphatase PAP2 family protein n=1 Tax=Halobaculum roseum TaxID=2175149 RepID=A0ABD5MJ28_9EURY|nr:phosphatase PAP2 family protein [Halobaculum roseum]QZY04325.1 phosphatase PAP2 family protein [Halobaculum roseum]